MKYIDFDGVILDTEGILFEEWRKIPDRYLLPPIEKIRHIQNRDWNYIINNSEVINDADYYLRQMDPTKSAILTKIHSLDNEAVAKIKWVRDNKIKQPVIFVPYPLKKTDVVDAKDSILVDDCLRNLDDWQECGGEGIFFNIDGDNIDSWQQPNIKGYQKVLSLKNINK